MSFDPGLVERVRDALARLGERGSRERRVFGGYGFLQGKSTFVIVWGDGIIAKMPPDAYAPALQRPGVTPFAPDGERPMTTWVVVSADVVADDPELAEWVALGLQGVRVAPAPEEKQARGKPAGGTRVTKQSSFREKRVARNASAARKRLSKKAPPRGKRR